LQRVGPIVDIIVVRGKTKPPAGYVKQTKTIGGSDGNLNANGNYPLTTCPHTCMSSASVSRLMDVGGGEVMYLCVKRADHWSSSDGRDIMPLGSKEDDVDEHQLSPIVDIAVITENVEPLPDGYELVNMFHPNDVLPPALPSLVAMCI
jgi:hypothetical protein